MRANLKILHQQSMLISQKQAFATRRTSIFLKNDCSPPAERTFSSKTSVCHPPNEHFSQKQAFVTRRTNIFLKNDCSALAEQAFDLDLSAKAKVKLLVGVAFIALICRHKPTHNRFIALLHLLFDVLSALSRRRDRLVNG